MLSTRNEKKRLFRVTPNGDGGHEDYRSEYRRDYARVLHSPSFRRLENKTQLFPGLESDFFRNRLTHSLEVAQIAKTIALKIKFENPDADIEPDVCEIAGLVHDMGHPPFGHNGENALDGCMKDFGGFEGNAQTMRIITRLEKKEEQPEYFDSKGRDKRVGLNLTSRVIASALKYDQEIPAQRKPDQDLVKGYYASEKEIVDRVKKNICGPQYTSNGIREFKTIDCSIMDLADDIAYSTYDLEDAFKAGFLSPFDMMSADELILEQIIDKLKKSDISMTIPECRSVIWGLCAEVWQDYTMQISQIDTSDELYDEKVLGLFISSYQFSKNLASDAYKRTKFSSYIIKQFINGIVFEKNDKFPILSKVIFDENTKKIVNVLKQFSYVALINSSRLKVAENRGKEIVEKIFHKLSEGEGYILLPEDFQKIYSENQKLADKKRVICDFIAGMTDRYALEFYCRLFSDNPQSIFKPL